MKGIRVRELLLVVAIVALVMGWAIDRARLRAGRERSEHDARARIEELKASTNRLANAIAQQAALLKRTERDLAACREGNGE